MLKHYLQTSVSISFISFGLASLGQVLLFGSMQKPQLKNDFSLPTVRLKVPRVSVFACLGLCAPSLNQARPEKLSMLIALGHMAIPGDGRVVHPNTNQMNKAGKLLPKTKWDAIGRKKWKQLQGKQNQQMPTKNYFYENTENVMMDKTQL